MRLVALWLLLTALALAAPGKPAFEVAETIYREAAGKAFEYGNYAACDHLLQELLKLYQGLLDHPKLKGKEESRSQVQALIRQVEGWRVFVLGGARYYSDAIRLGQTLFEAPDTPAETRLQAALGAILTGRAALQPTVQAALLEPATRLAQEQKNKVAQFALRSFAEDQSSQRRERPKEEVWAALAAAWEHMAGFRPQPRTDVIPTDALVFLEGERWWDAILSSFALTSEDLRWDALYTAEVERVEAVVDKATPLGRTDWWLGYLNTWLGDVEFCLLMDDTEQARSLLDYAEKLFVKPYFERTKKLESAHRQACRRNQATITSLAAAFRQDGMPVLDPAPLDFSLLAGSVSLIRARQLEQRARIILAETGDRPSPAQRAQLTRLLVEARNLQRSQGHFLGPTDVRWTMLRASLADTVTAKELLIESEVQGYRPGMVGAYSYQGFALASQGLKAEAVEKLRRAVALEEQFLAETGASGETLADLRREWEATYSLLARLQLELGDPEGAYGTLGRRQQLQALAAAGELAPEVTSLRGKAASLEQEVAAKRFAGHDSKAAEELLARTRGEYNTVIARLRQENPRYASLLAIRPVSFSKQQQFIPADTAIVQYFPAGESLYVFVATREELKIRQVAVTDAVLHEAVRAFRKELLAKQPGGERLHQLLLDPVEADIASKPVVAFIPTGMLSYVPFAALSKNGKYLVSRKQCVTLLKSADLDGLSQPANRRRDGLLALGNPDGSLPAAAQEATDVATLFGTTALLGKEASADKLAGAGKVAYVHLATHGFLNARNPAASYVQLASGPLAVEGIYDLKLDGVRLVTLSACQTALGEVNPGSELTTLADAFSLAGATAVVASLWSVDDQATRELMTEFYRRLKAGENLAQALQGAQVKLLEAGQPPFYWAPFVLLGDWR